jgi:hypothetical protein
VRLIRGIGPELGLEGDARIREEARVGDARSIEPSPCIDL